MLWTYNLCFAVLIFLILGFNFFSVRRWRKHNPQVILQATTYNNKVYSLVIGSVLTSIYILLKTYLVIRIQLGGLIFFEISFIFAFIFLATIISGPLMAGVAILIGNSVSYFLYPFGPFLLVFAAPEILGCTITWLFVRSWQTFTKHVLIVEGYLICGMAALATLLLLATKYASERNSTVINSQLLLVASIIAAVMLFICSLAFVVIATIRLIYINKRATKIVKIVSQRRSTNNIRMASNTKKSMNKYAIIINLFAMQLIFYLLCSLIADSLAIHFIYAQNSILVTLVFIRLLMLLPIVGFETAICFVFLALLPKRVLKHHVLLYPLLTQAAVTS